MTVLEAGPIGEVGVMHRNLVVLKFMSKAKRVRLSIITVFGKDEHCAEIWCYVKHETTVFDERGDVVFISSVKENRSSLKAESLGPAHKVNDIATNL